MRDGWIWLPPIAEKNEEADSKALKSRRRGLGTER